MRKIVFNRIKVARNKKRTVHAPGKSFKLFKFSDLILHLENVSFIPSRSSSILIQLIIVGNHSSSSLHNDHTCAGNSIHCVTGGGIQIMYCTIIIIEALHHNASIKALSGVTRSQNLHHPIIYSSWTTPTHHHLPAIIPSVCVCG